MDSEGIKSDHDLLIVLYNEVKQLREAIDNMRSDIRGNVADHETRIRRLESWGAMAIGGLFILELAFNFMFK